MKAATPLGMSAWCPPVPSQLFSKCRPPANTKASAAARTTAGLTSLGGPPRAIRPATAASTGSAARTARKSSASIAPVLKTA